MSHVSQGNPSPANSNSPTSPRLSHRQLRPLKAPLYVPAALRPTEHHQKTSPPTPPRSVHGSLDSSDGDNNNYNYNDGNDSNDSNNMNESVSRRSTMESDASGIAKLAVDEWMKNEDLGQVTGHPKRDHWKADSASSNCDSASCRSSFGLFLRRHHCRHCGHVFCSSHTPYLVPLDQDARFHPDGIPSRACDLCWRAYQRWEETRSNRLSIIQNSLGQKADSDNTDSDRSDDSQDDSLKPSLHSATQNTEIAASVPKGWNWSTF